MIIIKKPIEQKTFSLKPSQEFFDELRDTFYNDVTGQPGFGCRSV